MSPYQTLLSASQPSLRVLLNTTWGLKLDQNTEFGQGSPNN